MTPRNKAVLTLNVRNRALKKEAKGGLSSKHFGSRVFNRQLMKKIFSPEVFDNVVNAYNGTEQLNPEYADTIALALKDWAISQGATHYCHWFQPLTGASAEKHDSFIDWDGPTEVIEKFSGKELIQGEPDASSFPSGGLRSTYEARGYTSWDPSSPPFLWNGGDGLTLCIPSLFFSWTGDVLDFKIPLLRAEKKVSDAAIRLLTLLGIPASYVVTTLGMEQEYFVIDRSLANLRPDLILTGRTLFGAPSPKGQELQDHYFGAVKDRILCFMRDFEEEALKLGIPVKTRHNEVAPSQYEIAPVFEKASTAVDHNILLMELMRQIAEKHDLYCILHEKPFKGLNGSGKHINWALMTDTGINLFDPSKSTDNNLYFVVILAAVLKGVYKHAGLLRAAVGSAHNDHRLGGHEAPPAIISVYLGEDLEELVNDIELKGVHKKNSSKGKLQLGLPGLHDLPKHNSDRNRTSPFAFTGNKFEMRAQGSSATAAFTVTVMSAILAESLNEILDEVEGKLKSKKHRSKEDVFNAVISVMRKEFKESKNIRFSGDNYSKEWAKEAKKRKIPNIIKSIEAFKEILTKRTDHCFNAILSHLELQSRYDIMEEHYVHHINIETKCMIDMFSGLILPSALEYQKNLSQSILSVSSVDKKIVLTEQKKLLNDLSLLINKGIKCLRELKVVREKSEKLPMKNRGVAFCDHVLPKCLELRDVSDALELIVDDALWKLPKYRELLYMV